LIPEQVEHRPQLVRQGLYLLVELSPLNQRLGIAFRVEGLGNP
jgi:hypothetical protein